MIIHLINNWLLYHKMIPLCIVYDITCHISGFHSCVWALYPNLYTAFTICNFSSVFVKIVALIGALLTSCLTAFHWLDEFSNFLQILQYSQFSQFSQKSQFLPWPSQPLLPQVFTDATNFPIFCRFYNNRNFGSFHRNRRPCWGPLTGLHWLDDFSNFLQILQ